MVCVEVMSNCGRKELLRGEMFYVSSKTTPAPNLFLWPFIIAGSLSNCSLNWFNWNPFLYLQVPMWRMRRSISCTSNWGRWLCSFSSLARTKPSSYYGSSILQAGYVYIKDNPIYEKTVQIEGVRREVLTKDVAPISTLTQLCNLCTKTLCSPNCTIGLIKPRVKVAAAAT